VSGEREKTPSGCLKGYYKGGGKGVMPLIGHIVSWGKSSLFPKMCCLPRRELVVEKWELILPQCPRFYPPMRALFCLSPLGKESRHNMGAVTFKVTRLLCEEVLSHKYGGGSLISDMGFLPPILWKKYGWETPL